MNLVIPWTDLDPRTADAALHSPFTVTMAHLEDDQAYYRLLRRQWKKQQDFVILEQDIVPTPEQFEQFLTCDHVWCGFPYQYLEDQIIYNGAGFTKFSAELQRAFPELLTMVGQMENDQHQAKHWCTLDGFMKMLLEAGGLRKKDHWPLVEHLNKGGSSHGCLEARGITGKDLVEQSRSRSA